MSGNIVEFQHVPEFREALRVAGRAVAAAGKLGLEEYDEVHKMTAAEKRKPPATGQSGAGAETSTCPDSIAESPTQNTLAAPAAEEPEQGGRRRASGKPARRGPIPPTRENIATALSFLSADMDRKTWWRVLAAIKSALGEDGRDLAEDWSRAGNSYDAANFRDTWNSFQAEGGIAIGTLWKMALKEGWKPNGTAHQETEAERLERERRHQERARVAAEREARKRAGAMQAARTIYERAHEGPHTYLSDLRGVQSAPGLRVIDAREALAVRSFGKHIRADAGPLLIIPMYGPDGELCGLEAIDAKGNKGFMAGSKKGLFIVGTIEPGKPVAIVEGLATGLSVHQATGYAVAVAFDASSLTRAAKTIKAAHPEARILIAGDRGNGRVEAEKAAAAVGAALAIPEFTAEEEAAFQEQYGKAPSDWNDKHHLAGLDIVRQKIKAAGTRVSPANNPAAPRGELVYATKNGALQLLVESQAAFITAGRMRDAGFAHDSESGSWYRFTGECWALLLSAAEPERFLLNLLYRETQPIGFRRAYASNCLELAVRSGQLSLPPRPAGKIPFRNGQLDIASRILEPTTKATAATFVIPHDWTGSADCPAFMAWIRSATGNDAGLIELLRAFINAVVTGRADLQKFLHLMGPGGTGKSTFIRLLFAIVGEDNAISTDLRQLEQNRFEPACLHGKRLAAITDSDKYGGAVNVLKALTGQDPIRHERKHVQQAGTFVFEGMVIIASNEPIASTDYTSGLDRRRLVVKFDRRIPSHEKAAFLAAGGEARLHQEIPAIIAWALELSREEVTTIFMNPPAAAADAAFEALTAQNPIAEWITDNLVPAPGLWIAIGAHKPEVRDGRTIFEGADTKLYPNYLRWCGETKREALALRRFRHAAVDMLKTLGADVIEPRRGAGQGIQGVRLRKPTEPPYPWETGRVQDSSYTAAPPSVGILGLEAAPVQDVQPVQDFSLNFVEKNSEVF